jgi:hypothetical protein
MTGFQVDGSSRTTSFGQRILTMHIIDTICMTVGYWCFRNQGIALLTDQTPVLIPLQHMHHR